MVQIDQFIMIVAVYSRKHYEKTGISEKKYTQKRMIAFGKTEHKLKNEMFL